MCTNCNGLGCPCCETSRTFNCEVCGYEARHYNHRHDVYLCHEHRNYGYCEECGEWGVMTRDEFGIEMCVECVEIQKVEREEYRHKLLKEAYFEMLETA